MLRKKSFLFTVYHCLASDLDANLPMSLTFFRLNCTSSLYCSTSCQKSHPLQQANYLKSLHLHAKTFTKVRRLANQQSNVCCTVKPEFEANCHVFPPLFFFSQINLQPSQNSRAWVPCSSHQSRFS